jgi:hypothetical protein
MPSLVPMTCCRGGGKQFDVLRSAYLRQKRESLQKAHFSGIEAFNGLEWSDKRSAPACRCDDPIIVVCKSPSENHVIEPPGPSQFHSFVPIAPTLYGNSTNLWIRLSSLFLNLVGVVSVPLDLRYSNSARCTVETCLPTNVPPQITDDVRVSSNWIYKLRKNLE